MRPAAMLATLWIVLLAVALVPSVAPALTVDESRAVVAQAERVVGEHYVFPAKRSALSRALLEGRRAKRYDVTDPSDLAERVTRDLAAAGKDPHLWLKHDPELYAEIKDKPPDPDQGIWTDETIREMHHGYSELRLLGGGVRYVRVTNLMWIDDVTGSVVDDAMRFLGDGRAIIIDLRGNGGGDPRAVQYLVSHFLPDSRLLMTFDDRMTNTTTETRSLSYLPNGRIVGKPLYVLIDAGTASAAEELAYHVKQFRLGTLVGEGTAGAANNNTLFPIAPGFVLSVSTGRPHHPVGGDNWEGRGIAPDLACPPNLALDTAHLGALEKLMATETGPGRAALEWAATGLRGRLKPPHPTRGDLQAYAGRYGIRTIRVESDALVFQRDGRDPLVLTPLEPDLFAFPNTPDIRVRFRRTDGKVTGFDQVTVDGQVVPSDRSDEAPRTATK